MSPVLRPFRFNKSIVTSSEIANEINPQIDISVSVKTDDIFSPQETESQMIAIEAVSKLKETSDEERISDALQKILDMKINKTIADAKESLVTNSVEIDTTSMQEIRESKADEVREVVTVDSELKQDTNNVGSLPAEVIVQLDTTTKQPEIITTPKPTLGQEIKIPKQNIITESVVTPVVAELPEVLEVIKLAPAPATQDIQSVESVTQSTATTTTAPAQRFPEQTAINPSPVTPKVHWFDKIFGSA